MTRRRAFTLIELLVVVAIIALLISILLPSLSRARQQTKTTVCASNIRSLGHAMEYYVRENAGFYPGDHLERPQLGGSVISWAPRLLKILGYERGVFNCPSVTDERKQWKFVPQTGGNPPNVAWLGYEPGERHMRGSELEFFSYGYNGWGVDDFSLPHLGLGGHIYNPALPFNDLNFVEQNERKIRQPDDMIALSDAVANGLWDTWLTPQDTESWPSDRHSIGAGDGVVDRDDAGHGAGAEGMERGRISGWGGSNVLFCDGHVGRMRQRQMVMSAGDLEARALFNIDVERRRWNSDHQPHTNLLP